MSYVRPTILRRRANYTAGNSSDYRIKSTFYRYLRQPRNVYRAPWTSTTRTCGDADRKYAQQIAATLDAASSAEASAEELLDTVNDLKIISAAVREKKAASQV